MGIEVALIWGVVCTCFGHWLNESRTKTIREKIEDYAVLLFMHLAFYGVYQFVKALP